jgi:hypothetical protein
VRAVSDTLPLSYLVLIGQTDLLPKLFTAVSIPDEVHAELASSRAPSGIQVWSGRPDLNRRPPAPKAGNDAFHNPFSSHYI